MAGDSAFPHAQQRAALPASAQPRELLLSTFVGDPKLGSQPGALESGLGGSEERGQRKTPSDKDRNQDAWRPPIPHGARSSVRPFWVRVASPARGCGRWHHSLPGAQTLGAAGTCSITHPLAASQTLIVTEPHRAERHTHTGWRVTHTCGGDFAETKQEMSDCHS